MFLFNDKALPIKIIALNYVFLFISRELNGDFVRRAVDLGSGLGEFYLL
jgi:hypothetical protein